MHSEKAFLKLIKDYTFDSVLDIGCGSGIHSKMFLEKGKDVYAVDIGKSYFFKHSKNFLNGTKFYKGKFEDVDFKDKQFDCVWASHVMEHQRNIGLFLDKIHSVTKEGGIVCITVPPSKDNIVGGHLSIWNMGLIIYNLVLSRFDCSEISCMKYDYNLSVILKKKTILLPKNLSYDRGDIEILSNFFPKGCKKQGFDGNITRLNW